MLHRPLLDDQFFQAAKPVAGAGAPHLVQFQIGISSQEFDDVRLGLVPAGLEFERDQEGDRHNLERTVFTHDQRREPDGIFDSGGGRFPIPLARSHRTWSPASPARATSA